MRVIARTSQGSVPVGDLASSTHLLAVTVNEGNTTVSIDGQVTSGPAWQGSGPMTVVLGADSGDQVAQAEVSSIAIVRGTLDSDDLNAAVQANHW